MNARISACVAFLLLGLGSISTPLIAAPSLSASTSSEWSRVGETFTLTLEIAWTGAQDRYVLYPPVLELPAALSKGALRQHFRADGLRTVHKLELDLTALEPGPVPPGKVSVQYRATESTEGSGTLEAETPAIDIRPGGARGYSGTLLLVTALAAVGVLGRQMRKRRLERRPDPAPESGPRLEHHVLAARRALLEGDHPAVYQALLALKPLLPPAQDALPARERLEQARERARYGGIPGDRSELERLVRTAERCLKPEMDPIEEESSR